MIEGKTNNISPARFYAIWFFMFLVAPVCLAVGLYIMIAVEDSGRTPILEFPLEVIWSVTLLSVVIPVFLLWYLRGKVMNPEWLARSRKLDRVRNKNNDDSNIPENLALFSVFIIGPLFIIPVFIVFFISFLTLEVSPLLIMVLYAVWATFALKPDARKLISDIQSLLHGKHNAEG